MDPHFLPQQDFSADPRNTGCVLFVLKWCYWCTNYHINTTMHKYVQKQTLSRWVYRVCRSCVDRTQRRFPANCEPRGGPEAYEYDQNTAPQSDTPGISDRGQQSAKTADRPALCRSVPSGYFTSRHLRGNKKRIRIPSRIHGRERETG